MSRYAFTLLLILSAGWTAHAQTNTINCPPPNGCKFEGNGTFTTGGVPGVTVTMTPNTANLSTNGTQQFTATVKNDSFNKGVTWVLSGTGCSGATCGTISSASSASGVAITYTAPNVVPSPSSVTLTATSVLNPQVASSASAAITVFPPPPPGIVVTVAPAAISVTTSATQAFTCTVTNDSGSAGCDWTLGGTSPRGSLSTAHTASGVALTYTAPSSASSAVTLTAKSTTDNTKMAVSAITVVASPVISVNLSPTAANIGPSSTQSFTATVTNDGSSLGVTWIVTGAGCSGAACGTVSPTSSASGVAVTYTSPATAPNPNIVSVTATSVTDATKSANSPVTISLPPNVVNPCGPNFQTAAATNTFSCTASQGSAIGLIIIGSTSVTTSAAQACLPGGQCFTLTQGCPPSGPCFANVGGGMATGYYGIGLPAGLTTYIVSNAAFGQGIQAWPYDLSNVVSFNTAVIGGSNTASTSPSQSITTAGPGVILSGIATLNVTSISSPFVFVPSPSNAVGGSAYAVTSSGGVYSPTWLQQSAAEAMYSMSFNAGNTSPVVSLSVAPSSVSVISSTTASLTTTVSNSNAGYTAVLSGSGCSGATCGTLSSSSGVSGVPITYTAPVVVPSPATVTFTATSVTDPTKSATSTITVTPMPISVSVSPGSSSTQVSTVQAFSCTVGHDPSAAGCDWTLTGSGCSGATCGSLSSAHTASGVSLNYTAPGSVPSPATVTLTAKSTTDNTKTAVATITVTAAPVLSVSVSPGTANVQTSATQNFTATVLNDGSNLGVDWTATCTGTCGTVSPAHTASGVETTYTAPNVIPGSTVTITATSTTDATKHASSTVTVTAPPNIIVTIAPTSASVIAGSTQTFTSTVTNDSAGTNYTLTCTGTCGTVSPNSAVASGTPVTYTAPSSVPGSAVTLHSTSVTDGTKAATATITVTAPVISVSVSPTSTSISSSGTATFTATVANSASSVNWTVACSPAPCGSASPTSGATTTYTAPATNSSLTVMLTATSIQDGTKSATATITVSPVGSQFKCTTNCPAFPEAQGGGAATPGGRGGVVYEITQTADGPGPCNSTAVGFTNCSYRDCWMDTKGAGARYCVPRIAGIFPITAGDLRTTTPFMTVLGQLAPGQIILGGLTTSGALGGISTHDIVVRYVTMSPDNPNTNTGPNCTLGCTSVWIINCAGSATDLTAGGCHDIITDHLSLRHSGNKSWITGSNFTPGQNGNGNGTGPNHSITAQWILDYEPDQGHPVGFGTATDESCKGVGTVNNSGQPCLSPNEKDIDFHHDMLVNVDHRIPENSNRSSRWTNNIIYNWPTYANQWLGAMSVDMINNKYIKGPGGPSQPHPVHVTNNSPEMCGPPSAYLSGNIFGAFGDNTVNANQWGDLGIAIAGEDATSENSVLDPNNEFCLNSVANGGAGLPQFSGVPVPSSWQRTSPMAASNAFPIVPDSANQLDNIMLSTVGNSRHLTVDSTGASVWVTHRDAQDTRIINQYGSGGSGGFWPNGVTYAGIFYLRNATWAPNLPTSCPGGQTCLPFPDLQPNWQDVTPISGTPCTSSLHDGICDAWKVKYGLSTTNVNLYKTIDPAVGLPYLEVFADGLVP